MKSVMHVGTKLALDLPARLNVLSVRLSSFNTSKLCDLGVSLVFFPSDESDEQVARNSVEPHP